MDDKESVFHGHGESSEGHSDSPAAISTVDRVEIKEDLRKFVMMEVEQKTWAFLQIKLLLSATVGAVSAALTVTFLVWWLDVASQGDVRRIVSEETPPQEVVEDLREIRRRISTLEGKTESLRHEESPRSLLELPIFPPVEER